MENYGWVTIAGKLFAAPRAQPVRNGATSGFSTPFGWCFVRLSQPNALDAPAFQKISGQRVGERGEGGGV
jgi:hypothetical protein